MKLLCRLFGHKPKSLSPGFPVFCKRCLKDLSFNYELNKYVIDNKAFEKN